MGDLLSGTGLLSGNLLSNPAGSSVDPTGVDSNVMWMVEDPRMYVDDAETDLLR